MKEIWTAGRAVCIMAVVINILLNLVILMRETKEKAEAES
jgi:hypothetical protein